MEIGIPTAQEWYSVMTLLSTGEIDDLLQLTGCYKY